nr:hypothetical protein [Tanacetum cinerariifolium]
METVLTSMDAATVLANGVVDVPTGSGSIPTDSTPAEVDVPTGSDVVPTASLVFATATVVTPYRRRKGKEVMVESETPKKQKVQEQLDAQVARELEEQLEREDQRRSEQIARDAEIARIQTEKEFWSTASIETTKEGTKILASADGILRTVTESSLRRNFKLQDEEGISSLPDTELFEKLTLMGYNISLNQKFTFQKDEPASPLRDVSQGEAYPTNSSFIADQDMATIDKSSTLPYDSAPWVTSLIADEGSMQETIPELTVLCTSMQRQLSKLTAKFLAQEVEINRLKERVKLLEDREGVAATRSGDDAPIKGRSMNEGEAATERISDDSEEMASVLTFMDAVTVLVSGVVDVPTDSGSIPTASTPAEVDVPTGSDVLPTASLVFATATVVTPYKRSKGKEVMVESETPKKQKVQEQIDPQVARELEEQLEREDQRRSKQIAREAEIARIHAEEELQIMIDGLDRNNETAVASLFFWQWHLSLLAVGSYSASGNSITGIEVFVWTIVVNMYVPMDPWLDVISCIFHMQDQDEIESSALPPIANEHASPIGDDSQGEACPTDSGLEAEQDRANITKTSTLPSDSTPRVTSLAADEGSMQQQLNELMDLCTRPGLSCWRTEMEGVLHNLEKMPPIKGRSLDEGEEVAIERSTEKGSNDTEEMVNVLTPLDAATVLSSGVSVSISPVTEVSVAKVPTGSGSIPTASLPSTGVPTGSVPTGSGSIPTASLPSTGVPTGSVPTGSGFVPTASPIFTTATVATPYTRRKGKEKIVESETPKKKKIQEQMDVQMARQLEEEMERDAQRMNEQITRDAEITRIHVEE